MEEALIRTFSRESLENLAARSPLRGPFTREQIALELARRDEIQRKALDPVKYPELSRGFH